MEGALWRRHAAVQIRGQSHPDRGAKHPLGKQALRVSHGVPGLEPDVLLRLPLLACSDDFVFDNQMITQALFFGFRVGEISCPTHYFQDASSLNFARSLTYGLGVLKTSLACRLHWWGLAPPEFLEDQPSRRLCAGPKAAM